MDRNNMRSNYVNSGPRSLPHMGGAKRHNSNGHSSSRLSPPAQSSNNNYSSHGNNSSNHSINSSNYGNNSTNHGNNGSNYNNNSINQHDDIVNYIFDSWNKVTRELERGSEDAKYYQEVLAPRQLANFRPFNLEDWWGCRMMQTIRKQRS